MESSGLSGRMFGQEMPLQRSSAPTQNPHYNLQQPPTTAAGTAQMVAPQLSSMKQVQRYQPQASDEEEHGSGNDGDPLEGKRKGSSSSSSPWHRMKWTETMVRLLIMAVYYIGDDPSDPSEKKGKSSSSIASGEGIVVQQQQQQQHKKGKWKNVSYAMMQKGFRVSPQQCEDKFNDLNKRYKRVNDIIGRGTACKVVENQSMLDSMDHISPKLKEEVRKLLNSKHLFFREMCAFHSSCIHTPAPDPDPDPGPAPASASAPAPSPSPSPAPALALPSLHHQSPPWPELEDQINLPNQGQLRQYHDQSHHGRYFQKDEDQDDGDDIVDDDDDEEDDDEEEPFGQSIELSRKRARTEDEGTQLQLQFVKGEMMEVLSDASTSVWEKQQWVAARRLQLEEEAIRYEYRAFEIEKQRLKWFKFSTKKQMEMDKMKIDNDRKRLENDRMLLLLKRQHIEMHLQQQQPPKPKPSPNPSDSTENRQHVISNANAPIIAIP